MAHITKCKYFPRNVTNAQWHQECRLAKLEDLLFRLQERFSTMSGDDIFGTLKQEILKETFRSKEEIEREFKRDEELKLAKERWKNDFTEAMQKASIEWHREHPDPAPPTC